MRNTGVLLITGKLLGCDRSVCFLRPVVFLLVSSQRNLKPSCRHLVVSVTRNPEVWRKKSFDFCESMGRLFFVWLMDN